MKTVNVLILGAGGNVSQGIMSALSSSSIPCRVVGACIGSESLGLFFCDTAYISPYANDPTFVDWVINVCNKESIDIVLTGVEENILAIELQRKHFQEGTKAVFISSNLQQLQIGLNKLSTANWLRDNGCNYPKSANLNDKQSLSELIEKVGFPLIAKPNSGKGSVGIFIANRMEDLQTIEGKDYCVQELMGTDDDEYTTACYIDKQGNPCDMIIMHRTLKHGTTFMAEIVHDEAIRKECEKICAAFKPKGPLNIQLRMHKGRPVCFELNVRFSGTTPIRAHWGYNDVEAMIREYLFGEPIKELLIPQKTGKVYRYYKEAFIDTEMQIKLADEKYVQNCNQYTNFIDTKK